MNRRDVISIIIQTLIFVFSAVFLLIGAIKGSPDIGRLILYAWIALTIQQNIFYKILWIEKEEKK